jgi:hypothetical protein
MNSALPVYADVDDGKGLPGEDDERDRLMYPPGNWDYITSVPAYGDMSYSVIVPTLGDSSIADGIYYSVFFVRARTETPGVYYDAWPDSGWSVDNLAPAVPTGLSLAYNTGSGNVLAWDECPDEDFDYFVIYRSEDPEFLPGPGDIVQMVSGTDWLDTVDEGWRYFYKITAVDFNGNESDFALTATTTGSDDPAVPEAFALGQNVPNPFNPSTTIYYDVLDGGGEVSIRIFDVAGRLVRTLVEGHQAAGSKSVTWSGANDHGQSVSSGIYFYRMTAPGFTRTRKMVLLR